MVKSVFYSFHYTRDVFRIQLVREMGSLEGQPLMNAQKWEEVKARGPAAVQEWIDQEMKYKKAVIVLIGQQTASRRWVQYEIQRAWSLGKPLLGIRIHGLSSMGLVDQAGSDPFIKAGISGPRIFDPTITRWGGRIDSQATYNNLYDNLETWSNQGSVKR